MKKRLGKRETKIDLRGLPPPRGSCARHVVSAHFSPPLLTDGDVVAGEFKFRLTLRLFSLCSNFRCCVPCQ